MNNSLKTLIKYTAAAVFLGCSSHGAFAEITLIKQAPEAGDPLSRLNFTVGGSIRPQVLNLSKGDKGSYKRNGYDGGTRFRFTSDYYLFDDISWISYYELGVDFPRVFKWDNHYQKGTTHTTRRMLFTGLKSDTWGTLTFGKQNSVYYDIVGVKTDIWDYDMLGQAPGNGINGDYDGSYMSRNMLKYKKSIGDADIYAAYLFNDNLNLNNGLHYKRRGGGSLGIDYHFTKDFTWGAAWNYTRADMRVNNSSKDKTYDQNIVGTSLSWTPDNWTFSVGGGWYQNFLQNMRGDRNIDKYFADDAWGIEYYAGYSFPIGQYAVQAIQPYFMGDRLEYLNGRNYKRIDNGVGVNLKLDYGFSVQYEHVFTSSTDHQGDANLVRVVYDF